MARDFDLGMTGPPSVPLAWISSPPAWWRSTGGIASALILAAPTHGGRRWCWRGLGLATHWLLRESGGLARPQRNQEVRAAQRDADYAYRLAVDPPASKELRLFGLGGLDALTASSPGAHRLHELQYAATRLRERPI